MKKSAYSEQREMIVAEAINPIATELRLLDPADLISLLRFECYGSIADLVSSAAELYYHPGTINFGAGGEYKLEWEGAPEIVLDLELKPKGGAENNNYGRFLCATGRYAEAQGYFDKALADPFYKTPGLALANSGTCLLKAGNVAEAEKALRLAVEHNPNDGEALYQLASVLYEKGDFFNARAFVQRFESHSQPRPDALLLGRNIELRLGNGEAAKDYTRKLLLIVRQRCARCQAPARLYQRILISLPHRRAQRELH